MRKKYVKPVLFYENFELSQQIAACDYDSNNTANDEQCQFTGYNEDFSAIVTLFKENVCLVVPEAYCYHNATSGDYGIFNS